MQHERIGGYSYSGQNIGRTVRDKNLNCMQLLNGAH